MKLLPILAAITVAVALAASPATAQEPPATPTPEPTPPPEVSPPPTATPEPSPAPPPPAPTPAITAPAPPPAPEPPMPTTAPGTPPSPPAAAPAAAVARVADPPVVAILRAPAENPFGLVAEVPANLPPKLGFTDATATGAAFVSARVDANGRIMGVREQRDPIPSLAAAAQKSLARWLFDPARRGSESVETWAAMRLDLHVEIDTPRSVQAALIPVTPKTPIPRPLAWVPDEVWLESRKGAPPEGGVPLETVDTPPMPKKTPWDANSYKGPFSAKFWVKVTSSGIVEKAIPLEASDPILLGYLRRAMSTWTFRPAQVKGAPVDSWNELSLSGQVFYKVELKQISSLRRSLFGS